MKVILATGHERIDNFISGLDGIQVVSVLHNKETLVPECEAENFDCLIVSAAILPSGSQETITIINKITTIMNFRIVFLYGDDDENRPGFINYLISRGIHDFHYGEQLRKTDLPDLVFNPKTRDDVKHCIIDDAELSINDPATPSEASKGTLVPFSIPQRVIGFFGDRGKGKSVHAVNLSIHLAKQLLPFNIDVLLLDGDFSKSSIYRIFDIHAPASTIEQIEPNVKARTVDAYLLKDTVVQPYKNIPNLYILNGYPEGHRNILDLKTDDLHHLITALKNRFHAIVIDTDGNFENAYTAEFFRMSHHAFYFMDLNLDTLEYVKRQLIRYTEKASKSFHIDKDKVSLVVNRNFPSRDCSPGLFRDVLELGKVYAIDEDPNVTESINIKTPYVLYPSGNEKYLKAIDALCNSIYDFSSIEKFMTKPSENQGIFRKLKLPFGKR